MWVCCAVPGRAGLSPAVLQELRGPTGAHTQPLVCCLPGLLVQTDHHSLLHTWKLDSPEGDDQTRAVMQGSLKKRFQVIKVIITCSLSHLFLRRVARMQTHTVLVKHHTLTYYHIHTHMEDSILQADTVLKQPRY